MTTFSPAVQTVSEVTRSIKGLLGTHLSFVSIQGEISTLRTPYSGHIYFTLKDETSQIRAVLFKQQQRYLTERLEEGRQVICSGKITVYEQRGEYQIIVDFVDFKGAGPLQTAYEHLKKKLSEEGLFEQEAKKSLPFLPKCIGVITSPTGAAIHDFLQIARERFRPMAVEIYPSKVQGKEAAGEIVQAIETANQRKTCQVLVLCRGGGSIEDLWPFNEEVVARAIYASDIPIVSAIGHEVDFTIADFVADVRVPTPTAAAETVLPEWNQLQDQNIALSNRLTFSMQRHIENLRQHVMYQRRLISDPTRLLQHHLLLLDYTQSAMVHAMSTRINLLRSRLQSSLASLTSNNPGLQLQTKLIHFKELIRRFHTAMQRIIEMHHNTLHRHMVLLDAVSPLSILGRGYSLTKTQDGKVVRSFRQVNPGDHVKILLKEGSLDCQVTQVESK